MSVVPLDPDPGAGAWGSGPPRIAGATHVGRVRFVNQDAFGRYDDPQRGEILLIVADGLGGHRGGEVASRMATQLIGPLVATREALETPERLARAIAEANRRIHDTARKDDDLDGMGTTVVCLLLSPSGPSWIAHVGDSRLYRLRDGRIEPLTEDHSLVATLVRQGVLSPEDARHDPRRNQILRALGIRDQVEVDIVRLEPRPGDAYLLCTDGLHGLLPEPQLRALAESDGEPEQVVERLIEAANAAGGTDNVTCVLARLPGAVDAGTDRTDGSGRTTPTTAAAQPLRDALRVPE
ncbi:MAG: Stp1/IreP family PP2C-type Ser/Thr phosphatase [Myxococcota bacterium]